MGSSSEEPCSARLAANQQSMGSSDEELARLFTNVDISNAMRASDVRRWAGWRCICCSRVYSSKRQLVEHCVATRHWFDVDTYSQEFFLCL